nr:glycoside hydrolase family 31 protein [Clostridia bacterium]
DFADERTVIGGRLADGEAIYGGGERLDTTNKRGTSFALYTCDGWNNSSTSSVVIPLFLTTRGGGMFVNRYESSSVDFGSADKDTWSYSLRGKVMDCFFSTSGRLTDAITGYTSLTGKAYTPAKWMQGMHICRYSPDMYCFDVDKCKGNIREFEDFDKLYVKAGDGFTPVTALDDAAVDSADIFFTLSDDGKYERAYVKNDAGLYFPKGPKGNPSGLSVKSLMNNFINTDMKPAAASMEGRGWQRCFFDVEYDPSAPENKEDLRSSLKWLHEHGIRAMVYIRAGGVFSKMQGFKDEYLVHADIEITDGDGNVTVKENTTDIPWVLGTGENPDVMSRNGVMRTADYLDITNPEAVEWYFDTIWGELVEMGMDGAKIDFCETMPDGDIPAGNTVTHYKWANPGLIAPGTEHHAYPTYFVSLYYRKMLELRRASGIDDGFMVFTRGGGIGSQRSPYMWCGDQGRSFDKLDDQLLAVVNSGLSGIPFMSFDMAGYTYAGKDYFSVGRDYESAVFARAVEFTAFLTNMQTHGDVRHAYEMTEEVQNIYRNYLRLHDELMPYIGKYSRIASKTGIPPVRHPVLKYSDDKNVYSINDQFMLGDGLMVAPILTEDTYEREVYLPNGSWTDMLTGEVVEGGCTLKAKASLGQIPVYLDNSACDEDADMLCEVFGGITWKVIRDL